MTIGRRVELYADAVGMWRWRVWSDNGNILADSGQGYKNHLDCLGLAQGLFPGLPVTDPLQLQQPAQPA